MAKSLMPDVKQVARNAMSKVTGGYASEDEKEEKEKGRAVAKQKTGPESARRKAQTKRATARKDEAQARAAERRSKRAPAGKRHLNVPAEKVARDAKASAPQATKHGTKPSKTAVASTSAKEVKQAPPGKPGLPGKGGGPRR